jgi:hypothetical protein
VQAAFSQRVRAASPTSREAPPIVLDAAHRCQGRQPNKGDTAANALKDPTTTRSRATSRLPQPHGAARRRGRRALRDVALSGPPYLFFFTVIVTAELVLVAPLLSVAFAVSVRVPATPMFHL